MSGSRLDFGDCYTGIASSKVILMRNMTEVALHVELTSDRAKEITFELKLQQNRSRVSRAPRTDDLLSPTNSNDGSSLKGSLSPDGTKAPLSFSNMDAYGLDSDEDIDDNEVSYYTLLWSDQLVLMLCMLSLSPGRFLRRGISTDEAKFFRRKPNGGCRRRGR
jgi:hypothetical protein